MQALVQVIPAAELSFAARQGPPGEEKCDRSAQDWTDTPAHRRHLPCVTLTRAA